MALKPAAPAAPAQASPLASLPAPAGEAMAHTCAACHGTQGQLGDEAFMPLAGMPRTQFVRTMQDFRSGARPSTLMGHVADGFTDADLQAMGAFFESLPLPEAAR
jgi:sulfide dehydrogenase cytochrome subunit